jgi:universal stress protein A
MRPERFLVPTDFSPDANWALQHAIILGIPLHAHLILLHVRDDLELNPWAHSGAAQATKRKLLQRLLQSVENAGLTGEVALVHGVPWREIMYMAHRHNITLIVMGTHGRLGLPHMLLGSVAESVIRCASCPVRVTRHPASISQL